MFKKKKKKKEISVTSVEIIEINFISNRLSSSVLSVENNGTKSMNCV